MLVGVLGGSFDPPHLGHVALAELAEQQLGLDLVLWVPAANQWQKATETAANLRAHMAELAVSGHSHWQVSYIDLDRGGDTFTVETLADLALAYPAAEFVLLLGADAAAGLGTWHLAERLREQRIAVAERAGFAGPLPSGFNFERLAGQLPDISSTSVRSAVKAGESIQHLVPEAVGNYIAEVGLYL